MKLFVLGILFGWLVEWLLYTLFWKQRDIGNASASGEADQLRAALQSCEEEIIRLKRDTPGAPPVASVESGTQGKAKPALKPEPGLASRKGAAPAKPKASPPATPDVAPEKLLQKISGIGPKVSAILVAAGIDSYAAVADAGAEKLRGILNEAGTRYAMIDVSSWPDQAKLLDKGDEAALAKLLASLRK